ncbi:MAG: response regulator [Pseudomonadota bacterium]
MLLDRLASVWTSYRAVLARELRVLVVDDEPVIRGVLQQLLVREGFVVDVTAVAESARQRLEETAYDLLVVDKNLPGMSGLDLIAELQDLGHDVPAVLITGYPSVESITAALRAGAVDYIEKPFPNFRQLVQRLRAIVDQRLSEQVYTRMVRDLTQAVHGADEDRLTASVIAHELFAFKTQFQERPDVLLVEPVGARAEVTSDALQSQGLSVEHVRTCSEAAARLDQALLPSGLVVGLDDPGVLELLEILHAKAPLSGMLAVSHGSDVSLALRAIEAGAEDVVERLIEGVDVLVARVQRMVRRVRRQTLYTHLFATLIRVAQRDSEHVPSALIEGLTSAQRRYLDLAPTASALSVSSEVPDLHEVLEDRIARDTPRVNVRVALRYAERASGAMRQAATRNLSSSGLFVCTSDVVPPGTRVTVELLDPDAYAERAVRVHGQVVRFQLMVPDPRAQSGLGVNVIGQNPQYLRFVQRLLHEYGPAPVITKDRDLDGDTSSAPGALVAAF